MASQTQQVGADTSEQAVVAGVFADHSAGTAALEKLQAMGAQLRKAGVAGVLILAKDADGRVDAQAAQLPGASTDAQELEQRTIAALKSMAGVQGHPDAPAAELGHALRPGAIALVVFVERARVPWFGWGCRTSGRRCSAMTTCAASGRRLPGWRRVGSREARQAGVRSRRPARCSTGRASTPTPLPSKP